MVVIVGIGQLGGVFATGFLRSGRPVFPVNRGASLGQAEEAAPDAELVLVAVGEAELEGVLSRTPEPWRDRLVLLQNELLPPHWRRHGIHTPTVISVWFEKKRGSDVKVILPTVVHGPHSATVVQALAALDIPCHELAEQQDLIGELVLKNLYILTANVCGLIVGGTVGGLWNDHRQLTREVAREVLQLQRHQLGGELPAARLLDRLGSAFLADPDHRACGRTALERLSRAVALADQAGLAIPRMRAIRAAQAGRTPDQHGSGT